MKRIISYVTIVLFVCIVMCFLGCEDYAGYDALYNIEFDKRTIFLEKNEMVQIHAKVYPNEEEIRGLVWMSSDTKVATVDDKGYVKAVGYGSAHITYYSKYSAKGGATCFVYVLKEPRNFTVNGINFRMNLVEAGTFQMGGTGNSKEQPVHSVTITKDYYIGETEVTQALWKAVMGYSPTSDGSAWSSSYGLGDDYPAYCISYEDVQSFLTKLNSMTGDNFRMPTEAEWEFAARGGNKSKGYTYSGSNTIGDVAWYADNSNHKTHPVKTKAANELGIYDMSGNVREWCSDFYGDYSSSAQTDPTGPTTGYGRVCRGGSWNYAATYCRCADRNDYTLSGSCILGFRLAL